MASEFDADGRAIFRVHINPLVWWMWASGPLLILGVFRILQLIVVSRFVQQLTNEFANREINVDADPVHQCDELGDRHGGPLGQRFDPPSMPSGVQQRQTML